MSISRRGILTGTPVPRAETTMPQPSTLVTQRWSPEEVEQYLAEKYGMHPRQKNKEDGDVTKFRLSKEEYLQERLSGKSRADIVTELGISQGTLLQRLDKWQIRAVKDEDKALESLRIELSVTASSKQTAATTETAQGIPDPFIPATEPVESTQPDYSQDKSQFSVDKSEEDDDLYVTIRIPVMATPLTDTFRAIRENINNPYVSRDTMFRLGVEFLSSATAWAYKELVEILGEGDLKTPLQSYVLRKCKEFEPEEVTA